MSDTVSGVSDQFSDGFAAIGGRAGTAWVGALLALTGVLIATSLVNVGTSGVAFFYLAFLLPLYALTAPDRWADRKFDPSFWSVMMLVGACIAALILTTGLQLVIRSAEPGTELLHLWARLSFLVYFVVLLIFLRGELLVKTLIWVRRLLMVVFAYGIYQLPAKVLGLPLFLDWLRNNKSFGMYGYDEAGWIGIVRSTSIFAEPSQCTVPVIVFFVLNIDRRIAQKHRRLGWVLLVLFTIASFSRTAWLCLIVGITCVLACRRPRIREGIARHRDAVLAALLLLLLILPVWGTLSESYAKDLSALERSQSIALGVRMIKDAPLIGYGWNSFHEVAGQYPGYPVSPWIDFEFIHNMVVSYVQQAGLAGLFLAALPFIIVMRRSSAPTWITFVTAVTFLVGAEFGGDLAYSSVLWLWLAVLVNWSSAPHLCGKDGSGAECQAA